jgi:hypothetical protein
MDRVPLVVQFLRKHFPERSGNESTVEYRLTSSGTLYDGGVIAAEWYKSFVTRNLSPSQFHLFVATDFLRDYPQELSLTFDCPIITVSVRENVTSTFLPDDEIASDLTALLTLFTRRLITVACKVREKCPEYDSPYPTQGKVGAYWPRHPSIVSRTPTKGGGVETSVQSYDPLQVAFDRPALSAFFDWLAKQETPLACRFLAAARLYQKGLRLLYNEPDLSYQQLIFAIEAVSTAYGQGPDLGHILKGSDELKKYLISTGLNEGQIEEAIKTSKKSAEWAAYKFRSFIKENLPDSVWTDPDSLYPGHNSFGMEPTKEKLEEALNSIYRSRSASSHEGESFPEYIAIGSSPYTSWKAWGAFVASQEHARLVPSLTWFERVVHASLYTFTLKYQQTGT